MKPTSIDRIYVICVAALLVAWTCCLMILWSLAFDASGGSLLISLSAFMFAVWATARLPGAAARGIHRLMKLLRLHDVLMVPMPDGGKRETEAMVRLLGASAVFAAVCAAMSTGAVFLVAAAVNSEAVSRGVLWTPLGWACLKFFSQAVAMLPIALGISVVFISTSIILATGGRDIYAAAVRDWLCAVAVGLVLFSLAWWLGAHLLAMIFAIGVLLAFAAVLLFRRQVDRGRGVRPVAPVSNSSLRRGRMGILITFSGVTLAILVQMRLLADLAGLDLAGRVCWAGGAMALLAAWLTRVDRKSHEPGGGQFAGAVTGVSAVLMLQAAMMILSLVGGIGGVFVISMAIAAQVPLAAMSAIIISRQRQVFASAGGRGRTYVAMAAGGCSLAAVAYMLLSSSHLGMILLPAIILTAAAGGLIGMVRRARFIRVQITLAVSGTLLLCSVTASLLAAISRVAEMTGSARPGVWLTSFSRNGTRPNQAVEGCMPIRSYWRSDRITEVLAEIMLDRVDGGEHGGRWWTVTTSRENIPPDMPLVVSMVYSSPDPSAVPLGVWSELLIGGSEGDYLQATQTGPEKYDGVLLSPLPADHHEAWRCYNTTIFKRVAKRIHPGGVFCLRTQVGPRRIDAALSVAMTLCSVFEGVKAVVDFDHGNMDMLLLAGPKATLDKFKSRPGLFIVPAEKLWGDMNIKPIKLVAPSSLRLGREVSPAQVQLWLANSMQAD